MSRASDPCRFVLEQKVVAPPGQRRNYSSGSTVVLGAVLRKATGQAIDELARVLLFEPLGIADVEWYRNSQGSPNAATGLRLRPRDLAKIGQLVLQHGAWNGAQLVPAPWVDAATTRQTNDGRLSPSYGYQFWLERSLVHQREVRWSVALGLGGQRLYIAPALDLVVVVNAGLYKGELQVTVPKIIRDQYVLEALELP